MLAMRAHLHFNISIACTEEKDFEDLIVPELLARTGWSGGRLRVVVEWCGERDAEVAIAQSKRERHRLACSKRRAIPLRADGVIGAHAEVGRNGRGISFAPLSSSMFAHSRQRRRLAESEAELQATRTAAHEAGIDAVKVSWIEHVGWLGNEAFRPCFAITDSQALLSLPSSLQARRRSCCSIMRQNSSSYAARFLRRTKSSGRLQCIFGAIGNHTASLSTTLAPLATCACS